jgi:hypothetical protein
MPVLTGNTTVVTQAVVDLLLANPQLGWKEVLYGDIDRIPKTPTICVESGAVELDWPPSPSFWTQHNFTVYAMCYFCKVVEQAQLKKEADAFAEAVRDVIHQNKTLNDIVIHGNVTLMEPGIARRGGAKLRTTRLTIRYISKLRI